MSRAVRGERHPYNGKPFYCRVCGLGYLVFENCKDGVCELESDEDALERQSREENSEP